MKLSLCKDKCRWRRRKEARPGEIIDAALTLFVQKGFTATKLDDVAKEAGVSKGTVYLYFDSKETLFRAVVQEIIIPEFEKAESRVAQFNGTQKELIKMLVKSWWATVGQTRLANIPKLMVSEAALFPELAEFYIENVVNRARQLLEAALEKGIANGEFKPCEIKSTARLILAPLVFAAIWDKSLAPFDKESYDVEQYIDLHMRFFFDGISK